MPSWWKRKWAHSGTVLFKGELPPQPEEFEFLRDQNIAIKPMRKESRNVWALGLTHPIWGGAILTYSDEESEMPPQSVFDFAFMTQEDKEAAALCRSRVSLHLLPKHDHVLRDRKCLLRFLRAVMADDGQIAIDMLPDRVWTRADLDDELCHDADLDVIALFNIHTVAQDGSVYWMHTHGLSEIGALDFDIIDPSPELGTAGTEDVLRSLALRILEGEATPSMPEFLLMRPAGKARLVAMDDFIAGADPRCRALFSDIDSPHRRKHFVLCEPRGSFFGRLLGTQTLQPAGIFSGGLPDDPILIFSDAATELMMERAKKTYSLLRTLMHEFSDFNFPWLAKLGIRTDGGGKTDREHMWFLIHELREDSLDATLLNQPDLVSGMNEGDRGRHSIDLLSDWMALTPAGPINPRSTVAARMIRADPEGVRREMREN